MEVHHHSHTPRKKFNHYFWEFFMLFLAVTAGFFVENQREHFIEHRREKQYIRSLISDVSADTVRLNEIIYARTLRDHRLDSMNKLLNSDSARYHTNYIYSVAVSAARTLQFRFVPNDGTMQQLKNSGALRLIRNHTVTEQIAKYDVAVRNGLRQGELEETLIDNYRSGANRIFNALQFSTMLDSNNNVVNTNLGNPPLLAYTKSELNEFNYKLYSMMALNKAIRRDMRQLLERSKELVHLLEREYDLD
jgi:hypothetical protein